MRLCGCTVMRLYGHAVVRLCGCTVVRLYGYAVVRSCGCTVMRLYGYAVVLPTSSIPAIHYHQISKPLNH